MERWRRRGRVDSSVPLKTSEAPAKDVTIFYLPQANCDSFDEDEMTLMVYLLILSPFVLRVTCAISPEASVIGRY